MRQYDLIVYQGDSSPRLGIVVLLNPLQVKDVTDGLLHDVPPPDVLAMVPAEWRRLEPAGG